MGSVASTPLVGLEQLPMANTRLSAALARLLGKIVWQEALGLTSWCRQLLVNLLSLEWAIARRREVDIWHCLETLSGTEEAESKPFLLGM